MRTSNNEEVNGIVKNGFDYHLQVWVKDFMILGCSHKFDCGCNQKKYAGFDIRELWLPVK